jgi:hypothetical protein
LSNFGLKNFDPIIYASCAAEALILSGALLASGVIVRNDFARCCLRARSRCRCWTTSFTVIFGPRILIPASWCGPLGSSTQKPQAGCSNRTLPKAIENALAVVLR